MIDDHDYDVKNAPRCSASSRKATRSRSPCAIRRPRKWAHQEIGTKLLDKVKSDVAEFRQGRAGREISRAARS